MCDVCVFVCGECCGLPMRNREVVSFVVGPVLISRLAPAAESESSSAFQTDLHLFKSLS
jgi:hypothetical protein